MHEILDMPVEQGSEGMADAMVTTLNMAMKIERSLGGARWRPPEHIG